MPDARLHVALVWHMHQPLYRDPSTGNARLPWVRLHAWKDYLDMLLLAEEFPGVRMTFNMVPSLLEQILDYAEGRVGPVPGPHALSRRRPDAGPEDVHSGELLHGPPGEHDRDLSALPRPLRQARRPYAPGSAPGGGPLLHVSRVPRPPGPFQPGLDRPDPSQRDPSLGALVRKGEGFTEEDKEVVLASGRTILNEIVPAYKRACEAGKIEISTTPYFHPILPLLIDTNLARAALPDAALPRAALPAPRGRARAVGAPSPSTAPSSDGSPRDSGRRKAPFARPSSRSQRKPDSHGWRRTRRSLARSLGLPIERDGHGLVRAPERLYRPYWAVEGSARIAMIFRDHVLSDLIGFTYAGWPAEKAADDFIARLRAVRSACASRVRAPIVPIILDGENAWEFYPEDGVPFLRALYGRLEREDGIVTTTVSDYLRENPPAESLPAVFPGSWINHNFKIWIGHEEDNLAWQWLAATRDVLVKREAEAGLAPATREEAWRAIYAAEGERLVLVVRRRPFLGERQRFRRAVPVPPEARLRPSRSAGARRSLGARSSGRADRRPDDPVHGVHPAEDRRAGHALLRVDVGRALRRQAGRRDDAPRRRARVGPDVRLQRDPLVHPPRFHRSPVRDVPGPGIRRPHPASPRGALLHQHRRRSSRGRPGEAGRVRIENGEGEEIRRDAGEAALDEILEAAIPFEALGFAPGDEAAFSIAVTDREWRWNDGRHAGRSRSSSLRLISRNGCGESRRMSRIMDEDRGSRFPIIIHDPNPHPPEIKPCRSIQTSHTRS